MPGGPGFLKYTRTFPLLGACADISTEPTIPPLGVWPVRYSRFVRRIAVTGEASVRSCATEESDDGTLLDVSRGPGSVSIACFGLGRSSHS